MDYLLLTCLGVSFLTTYILMPYWIRAALKTGLVGRDQNKFEKPEVAEFGGIAIVAGFMAGVLTYIGLNTFYFNNPENLIVILAAVSTLLGITIVGMLDDILGWKIGLAQWEKPLLTLPVALPMMVVNAGESMMNLPIFGGVEFGILYPLIIIPAGIVGAANGYNMLAGYNGLEASMGVIILGALGFVAWQGGVSWVAVLALCMVFSLLAFLRFNWHPARIFPGDTATYSIGALIACIAIMGDMEKIAMGLFTLYFIEFLIKAGNQFKGECFGNPTKDNVLVSPEKPQSLIHIMMKLGKFKEPRLVAVILGIQLAIVLLVLLLS
jgi:UDP-N-acetylglucosamine--dolichyl-phosphate N-acetylglucosaminephosphotransferase